MTIQNCKVPKWLFSRANRKHNHHKDIQAGIFPKQILKKLLIIFTWHGHSECPVLKVWTHVASQLESSLQSKMHWPRVLLFFDRQASMLSSLVASFNEIICLSSYIQSQSSTNKLTLQKHIGFWQLLQPSRQSVWHGQAEYKFIPWDFQSKEKLTFATSKGVSLAFQHAISITTSSNAL